MFDNSMAMVACPADAGVRGPEISVAAPCVQTWAPPAVDAPRARLITSITVTWILYTCENTGHPVYRRRLAYIEKCASQEKFHVTDSHVNMIAEYISSHD